MSTIYFSYLPDYLDTQEELFDACKDGDVDRVKEILEWNPDIDVNWRRYDDGWNGWTSLHIACDNSNLAVVSVLLAHPDIDGNSTNRFGWTPFLLACYKGRTPCVRLLLKDPRVRVNAPNDDGCTPLWEAACQGHLDIVKWWVASGRGMDLGEPGNKETDAISIARHKEETEVATLLERFKENPKETRHAVRGELAWYDPAAAEIFALVIFLADDLLRLRRMKSRGVRQAKKFFKIALQLPLELQMALCYRVIGSAKEIIPWQTSEVSFKTLSTKL